MNGYDDILQAAFALSPDDRERLIVALTSPSRSNDSPLSDEWVEEIRRRGEAIDAGTMTASPWHEARARARRKAGLDG